MTISTYSELKTAVNNWLDRSEADGRIDEFIDLAEARHAKDIRLRGMIVRETGTLDDTTRFQNLPTDHLQTIRFMLDTTPETILRQVSAWELTKRPEKSSGKPLYFAIHTQLELDRTPDSAYSYEHLHYAKFTALDDTNTSNGLLTNHPDIYFYSTLAEAYGYLHDDESQAKYEALYKQRVQDAKEAEKKDQFGMNPLHSQPNRFVP